MTSTGKVPRSLAESIVLTLLDLVSHLTKNGQELAGRSQLTVQQWLLLLQVAGDPNFPGSGGRQPSPGLTVSEVARARGVARASVSALVSALLRRGLVEQTEEPRDRRHKYLEITDEGLTAIQRIEPERRRANERLFAPYSRGELESLLQLLRGCLDRLSRARGGGSC
jgi:DNA-binding MarR family transcriptional regulator